MGLSDIVQEKSHLGKTLKIGLANMLVRLNKRMLSQWTSGVLPLSTSAPSRSRSLTHTLSTL
eukprot:906237-Pleurochrysis_carterae.AAC.5